MLAPRGLAAIALASVCLAQTTTYCSQAKSGNLCYSVSIPDATASSGSGDVYFQIRGPASKQWIALGQGGRMAGANMFMIYANSEGSNVTLSARDGKNHNQPMFDQGIQAYLLEGSGIANGTMTANVRCSSCIKWQASTLDVNSTKTAWIWAAKDGPAVNSDSQGANLQMHDSNGQFSFDLTQARSGNSLNPFIARAATTTATGSSPSATAAASGSNSEGGSDSAGGDTAGGDSGGDDHGGTKGRNILIAHGVLMCLAWVVFAPLGAIIVRAISGSKVVRMHYGTQILAYVLALTGTALGIYIAVKISAVGVYHPVIGLLVMGLATVQPVLGTIHHRIYKIKGQRTWWAVVHVWLGRVVITLAIINGGLGLLMAANTRAGEIVYGIFAGLIWLGWMAVAVWSEAKKATARESADGQKGDAEKVESS